MFNFVLAPDHPSLARVWLVGCGAMGGALLERWLEAGLPADAVTVIDPEPRGLPDGFAGAVASDAVSAFGHAPDPTLLVLGIKPQLLPRLAPGLARLLQPAPLVLSMLAGVRTQSLAAFFPDSAIIRMMPNTPARIGRGVTALFEHGAATPERDAVEWLMSAAGATLWLKDETQFDAVTAVSGSGPAYVFRFLEAFIEAAKAAGLPADLAAQLARETVAGAAELARSSPESPAQLREQVTSPNGTTAAGLQRLDGDGLLSSLLRTTVKAAAERSRELAADAEASAGPPPRQRAQVKVVR
ncbi:MAG: pyrroline-5-carboxylate reductase [Sandaracinobacteroides sp.]